MLNTIGLKSWGHTGVEGEKHFITGYKWNLAIVTDRFWECSSSEGNGNELVKIKIIEIQTCFEVHFEGELRT